MGAKKDQKKGVSHKRLIPKGRWQRGSMQQQNSRIAAGRANDAPRDESNQAHRAQ